MHELAICRSLLQQVLAAAPLHDMRAIGRITLRIGPLSGVEPDLLRAGFPLVAAGTPCEGAIIAIETMSVLVRCKSCGATSVVRPNRLLCGDCGEWRVALVSGDEMLLASIELCDAPAPGMKDLADV
jgi:hydrogenase nickel incorporation protein HypA/HybF